MSTTSREIAERGPAWRSLFHGCVRESLAHACSVARIGTQETHAWERPLRYVSDDNQGNVGIVEFCVDGAVGAISARVPDVRFSLARTIDLAPSALRDALIQLCGLPLLQSRPGVSAAFWTVGELMQGVDGWRDTSPESELLRHELLTDANWETVGTAYYDLTVDAAHLAIAIAQRAAVGSPIVKLSERELSRLIPMGSKHEREAHDLLFSDGLFEVAHGATV